jgi:hypothetical protein
LQRQIEIEQLSRLPRSRQKIGRRFLGNAAKTWSACAMNGTMERLNDWLQANKKRLSELRQEVKETEEKLGSAAERIMAPMIAQAKELGDSSSVTPPNLASLMLLVEQGN